MERNDQRGKAYWDRWIDYFAGTIVEMIERIKTPAKVPRARAHILYDLSRNHWELMLLRYSRGDSIHELAQYFPGILTYWEQSNQLHTELGETGSDRGAWDRPYLNWYQLAFWLVGLALTVPIPDDQWQRLLGIIDNEGKDILLDRIIATRDPERKIGTALCHPRPYARLLEAVDAPPNQQAQKLASFVHHWYRDLNRNQHDCQPYWYGCHKDNDDAGTYFGYWCIEAVAAVKAFGLDDSLCLDHPHYPGDLLRPDGPAIYRSCP